MRELERDHPEATASPSPALPEPLAIVGTGRAGGAIANAARAAGVEVRSGGRDFEPRDAALVLLCVPDGSIAEACRRVTPHLLPGAFVGHSSGATTLEALDAAREAGHETFSVHPLQTIPSSKSDLSGAPSAIAGSSEDALRVARALAERLGMRPFGVPEEGRAAYHAAAAMASNFLVSLEESAAGLMATAGVDDPREVLAPLVLRTAANWADSGAQALTGPIARGDEGTVALHLRALSEIAPELAPLYEALAERTRRLGRTR